MKSSARVTISVIAILAAVIIILGGQRVARSASADKVALERFLVTRTQVYSYLQEEYAKPREGAVRVLPAPDAKLGPLPMLFPPDDHIRHVVKQFGWAGGAGHEHVFRLDESRFPPDAQGNSLTFAPTVLLNEYFGGLAKLGFRTAGDPGATIADGIRSASNNWFREGDRSITVSGTVVIALDTKIALVSYTVHEHLPRM